MALTDTTPTSAQAAGGQLLGCGRSIDSVWARIELPPDDHEASCPDCQAARADLADLALATHDAVRRDEADPTLRLDAGALTGILQIARAEVRRGRRIPLEEPQSGLGDDELTVSEQTLVNLIRATGDGVAGVELRRCAVTRQPAAAEPGSVSRIEVELRVSVAAEVAIPEVAGELRELVVEVVERQVGVVVERVDILVEDVHHE